MGKNKIFIIIFIISFSSVCNASIIHYSLGGTMRYADTDWNNIYTVDIFGDIYISDIPLEVNQSNYWGIVSFAINADDKGWGGSGTIWTPLYGTVETQIHLESPSGTDLVTGSADFNLVGFDDPDALPDYMDWPGFGWYLGEEYFAQILDLTMTAVPTSSNQVAAPEPSTFILMISGLLGLGFARRRVKK